MNGIFSKLYDGGPLIMYTILFILIAIIILFIIELIQNKNDDKAKELIKSLGWFTLVWGFFGQALGLVSAFDAIQAAGDVSPAILSGGLKRAILGPLFGTFTFLVARVAIIVLILKHKKTDE